MINPFANKLSSNSIIVPLSAMMIILGILLSVAWIPDSKRLERLAGLDPDQRARIGSTAADDSAETLKLQKRNLEQVFLQFQN